MDPRAAHEAYVNKLVLVESVIGSGTTWLSDLERLGRRLFGAKFDGVYPSDRIPKLTDEGPYAIVNTDNSSEPGSHWVALCKNGNSILFYDSFGRPANRLVPSVKRSGNGRVVNTDMDAEQGLLEQNCGARCLAWLWVYDQYGAGVAKMV